GWGGGAHRRGNLRGRFPAAGLASEGRRLGAEDHHVPDRQARAPARQRLPDRPGLDLLRVVARGPQDVSGPRRGGRRSLGAGGLPGWASATAWLVGLAQLPTCIALFAKSGFLADGGAYGFIAFFAAIAWVVAVSVVMLGGREGATTTTG